MQKLNRFKIPNFAKATMGKQDLRFRNGILILIILTTYFLLPTPTFAHGGVNDEDLIIRMTKDGFEPKELTAVEGDEVLFINNDDVNRWPASNFHPTHTLYPEFDPLKSIQPGESWKFKFGKVGTWRMHDHLLPHMTGTIVVLESPDKITYLEVELPLGSSTSKSLESPDFWTKIKFFLTTFWQKILNRNTPTRSDFLSEFKSLNEKDKYSWLENVSAREGPEAAWNYVLKAYRTPQGVVGNPHDMAHLVGQLIYKNNGLEGLPICTADFAFGCYHGLMEAAFAGSGSEKAYQEKLSQAQSGCEKIGKTTDPTYWSCIHGMGHGIVTYRGHDLAPALKDCDFLSDQEQTYCYDGIFMENSISAPANFYKESDPIYPCDAVAGKYKSACARSQVQVMRLRLNMDTEAIADACVKSNNADIIYHCVDALGYFIAQAGGGDAGKIISGCNEIQADKYRAQCLAAAAGELVFQDAAGWQRETDKICASLRGGYRASCETRISQVKKSYGRE